MSLKKKKYIIFLTVCVAVFFILYQLYFFLTITSEVNNNNRVIPVLEQSGEELKHFRSDADKNINNNGVIKGVLHSNMPRYRPDVNNRFKCIKSEQHIPFEQLNDDYCDCEDGTDEPSTNACANGTFYCDTQYQNKPVSLNSVPSSRVNDGICDCCDGSDEWLHQPNKLLLTQGSLKIYRHYSTKCFNICFSNK